MLITGSVNTLSTKFQDMQQTGVKAGGEPIYFQHPAIQSACMFLGNKLSKGGPQAGVQWRQWGAHNVGTSSKWRAGAPTVCPARLQGSSAAQALISMGRAFIVLACLRRRGAVPDPLLLVAVAQARAAGSAGALCGGTVLVSALIPGSVG